MCGRFITPDEAALERHFGLTAPPDFTQSFNLAPSRPAPVIRLDPEGARDLALLTWGFQPVWARRAWINARSETVFETKAFAAAARKRRCLVPAIGWYEWQGAEAPRQPYVFHLGGFRPFAFAGIWTARETDAGWVRSFAILTTAAEGALRAIHDRKPLVLAEDAYTAWLSPDTSAADAKALLASDFRGIVTYRVSPYVNKPANDDPGCIAPLEETPRA